MIDVPTLWTEAERQRFQRIADEAADHFVDTAKGDTEQACKMLADAFRTTKNIRLALIGHAICRSVHVAKSRYRGSRDGSD